jgi:unsaturated rhamnogalacturonyl hydrolase
MLRRQLLATFVLVIMTGMVAMALGLRASAEGPTPQEVEILDRISTPSFPDRQFAITDYDAVAESDCTDAIARAIAACRAAGGGRVVVPAGRWRTAAIRLASNVDLHVSEGATLVFDPDPKGYLPAVTTHWEGMECRNYSPLIYANGETNVAVTGEGVLDGSATWDTWWAWCNKADKTRKGPVRQKPDRDRLVEMVAAGTPPEKRVFGDGHFLRPNFIQPYRCTNVLVEGVTIVNSPMWEVHPVLCTNVTVRKVTVKTLGPNNDGCNPECCRDVLIEDCLFETGDDCIAIKSGRNNDGRRIGVPCENIVIRRCSFKDGHGGVTLGSEISGGVRNVFVSDCRMDSPDLDRAFRFKSNAVRGGVLENVRIRDVQIGQVGKEVLCVEFDYEEGAKGDHHPVLRGVTIELVTAEKSGQVIAIRPIPKSTIEDIVIRDCTFRGAKAPPDLRGGDVRLMNVTIEAGK